MGAPNAIAGIKGFVKLRLSERFWNKVALGERAECWRWLGATKVKTRPYGMIWVDGKNRPAPQVAWELENAKPFPEGRMACHTCDNPACVNPAHIWPGTMSENIRDAVAKGRHKSNAEIRRRPNAERDSIIHELRKRYSVSVIEIAGIAGLTQQRIYQILSNAPLAPLSCRAAQQGAGEEK